jgi:membrane-bound lytic murein transglycosylase A
MHRRLTLVAAALTLAACASTGPHANDTARTTPERKPPGVRAAARGFSDIPDWTSVDLAPALLAFRSRLRWPPRARPDASLPGGGRYGGTVGGWAPACTAAQSVAPGGERAFFEANFIPHVVRGPGEARLTAYYEPIIEARRVPDAQFRAARAQARRYGERERRRVRGSL